MSRRFLAGSLVLALAFTGCATIDQERDKIREARAKLRAITIEDLTRAIDFGVRSREAGIMPSEDRWPECFAYLRDRLVARQNAPDLPPGVALAIMRAHVALRKVDQPVNSACAQVRWNLIEDGAKLVRIGMTMGADVDVEAILELVKDFAAP